MNRINVKTSNTYDIVVTTGFQGICDELKSMDCKGCKAMIVSDTTVAPLYLDALKEQLATLDMECLDFVIEAGELSKTLDNIMKLYSGLIENKLSRSDFVFALGGGVVGDMAGFAAATYRRGLRFVQVPTTLLAMVDSSIGGKNGVDYNSYKNMIGSFYDPILIYDNLDTIKTLDDRQFANGFAEAMKSAIINDAHYYEWMVDSIYEINDRETEYIEEVVVKAATIKKLIVENDPLDKGKRALLNLGHTIGHAIEADKMGQLLHGECVALGTIAAAYISWKKEMLTMEEYYEIRDMFVPFNLPISVTDIDKEHILENITHDKKNDQNGLKFILIKSIGKAVVDRSVTTEEIMDALKEIEYTDDCE